MSEKPYKIVMENEYYSLKDKKCVIALLMMVKNEHERLQITLDTIVGHVDCMVVYDTGSTDNTMDMIQKHTEKHKINLYMIQGEFVDFSTSRNVSLDYADSIEGIDFVLLMDCNDELRGGENLRKYAISQLNTPNIGYLMIQEWWSGKYDSYYNMRFIKARKGWRYVGVVHEYLGNVEIKEKDRPEVLKIPNNIVLYQDRTKDDDKSKKRFIKDRELLLKEYKKDPKHGRTLFYLAQTCSCLGNYEEAFYYYKLRAELPGFQEENFHSLLRAGEISQLLGHSWYDTLAYANLACKLSYPPDAILFVNKHDYDYNRWHILGIVSYYCKEFETGKKACEKAILAGNNVKLDKSNLAFYSRGTDKKQMTRNQFVNEVSMKLKEKFPKMSQKQIHNIARTKWKEFRKNEG
jgi:glycosyltransferase involved in cell wall biosynthesis